MGGARGRRAAFAAVITTAPAPPALAPEAPAEPLALRWDAPEGPDPRERPAQTSVAPPPPASTAAPPPDPPGFVRIDAGGGLGLLPQPGVTLDGAIGYRRRWLRVGDHGRYRFPQRVNHPLDATVRARRASGAAAHHGARPAHSRPARSRHGRGPETRLAQVDNALRRASR